MPDERFPHLFLPGPTSILGFKSPVQGGGVSRIPSRIPGAHSARLQQELENAWNSSLDRQAAVHSTRQGCYIEFVSAPGAELALKSLEDYRAGIRLLNVRKQGEGQEVRTLATVYIPKEKRSHFLAKIKDYGDPSKNSVEKGTPRNQALVAPVEEIATAILQDFWTDPNEAVPGGGPIWVEVWLRTENEGEVSVFRSLLAEIPIEEHPNRPLLRFPERTILLVLATGLQLAELIEKSDLISELRAAREIPTFFLDLENREQAEWCQSLVARLDLNQNDRVAVCILDEGVNREHPLIQPVLATEDLHAYDPDWGTADNRGHGTLMAGLASFGNLQAALESTGAVAVTHCLESAKILPPPPQANPKHLWGHVTAQGISRAEIQAPARKRIVCLAVTAQETRDGGHPTSWSAELDSLAAGVDGTRRLIVVSAGNVHGNWENYPDENLTNEVNDPAQSWNALSVGACTFKTAITTVGYEGYLPVAPPGALSPYSTTSLLWDHDRWPIKPEIVVEGGNVARSPSGEATDPEDLRLLSTCHDFSRSHFWPFEATSAASAQVAWMAARIQAAYPDIWPETVRGLLVHSASWTSGMLAQFPVGTAKGDYVKLLRSCGYGVPDLNKAISCLRNSLSLIAEQDIQPFVIRENKTRALNKMHLYDLPWPQAELLSLGEMKVSMRVTLSFFVEPGPGEVGWSHRYRYASHGLRFELNGPNESQGEFVKRINTQAREEEEGRPETKGPTGWTIGTQRNVGSIHSDIWSGRAADLATSNLIAVRPILGWWRERYHLGKVEGITRYALLVSIETPSQEVDIYTPVALKVGIPVPVEVWV